MPPPRKKGNNNNNINNNTNNNNSSNNSGNIIKSNKVKSVRDLQLGDLVLAKVKGFPPWPAKVSRPEDWQRVPDPKKYFVQFFGTQEIAFVAPPDIQAFTSEAKSKLLARCKGKTVKYFAQAVKEICEAFEELLRNDVQRPGVNGAALARVASKDDALHVELTKGVPSEELHRSNYVLGRGPSLGDSSNTEDKQAAALEESGAHFRGMVKNKMESHRHVSGNIESSPAGPPLISLDKEEKTSDGNKTDTILHRERIESSRASGSSPYSGRSDVERDSIHPGSVSKDTCVSLGVSGHRKIPADGDKKSANGHKANDIIVGAKRKIEGVLCHTDDVKSGKYLKDQILGKVSTAGNAKQLSSGVDKFESHPQGKASKSMLKGQKQFSAGKKSPGVVAVSEKHAEGEQSRQRGGQIGHEETLVVKKAKHLDRLSEAAKESIFKNGKSGLESEALGEDAVSPVAKRRRQALEAMSYDDKKGFGIASSKNDVPKKRRAVRLCDDDDDEPKTPVHAGSVSARKVSSSSLIPDSIRKNDENENYARENVKGLKRDVGFSQKDHLPSAKPVHESSIGGTLQQKVENSAKAIASRSPGVEASDKRPVRDIKADLISPLKSPQAVSAVKKVVDQQKPTQLSNKGTSGGSHSKTQTVSGKDLAYVSGGSNSLQTQVSVQKSRQVLSAERTKGNPKTSTRLNELAATLDNQKDHDSVQRGRLEDAKDLSGSLVDPKALDATSSMKNLIAAAQAKRRLAQRQNVPHANGDSVVAPSVNLQVRSPSPVSTGQPLQSGGGNVTQLDAQGIHSQGSFGSPSFDSPAVRIRLLDTEKEESEDKGLGLGVQAAGSILSGGTEAAVARDAFEGMIETLSRTKESIGRATRLAIDCAKYGIANEVVDLLIRKLENESSFHRRVDLFFLVDSITQCSHSQKGIAGASYIPIIQSALPRLLGAAAPPGASARENRRQCLKVLRLWLERKILPEPVIKRFMEDIGGSNDDTSSGLSFRRPSRAERSVDDPIREMEGMLVDEYGSNATFNLPGFLSTHGFVDDDEEDEEDVLNNSFKESDASPLLPFNASAGPEMDALNDRRHHILEDVDGELEMEDVSGHPKDGTLSPCGLSETVKQEMQMDTEVEPSTNGVVELLSPEGSPPLPLESPPPLPPLPSSPPPPPPPMSSPSPPPPPPPPSILPLEPPQPSLLLSGPQQAVNLQPLPQQPSVPPQVGLRPPSVIPPVQGSHAGQVAGNTPQQMACFLPAGQSDIYAGPQAGQSNQLFQQHQQYQPCQATFAQRGFTPVPLAQAPSGHFPYHKPTVQQHIPHPRPHPPPPQPTSHPFSASNSEGLRRFGDEQWRSNTVEYKAENHQNTWVNGGRPPSCPPTTFNGEAFFRPPERTAADNMGYQISAQNSGLGGPSTAGHVINQMLPSRPDVSSLTWRPV